MDFGDPARPKVETIIKRLEYWALRGWRPACVLLLLRDGSGGGISSTRRVGMTG